MRFRPHLSHRVERLLAHAYGDAADGPSGVQKEGQSRDLFEGRSSSTGVQLLGLRLDSIPHIHLDAPGRFNRLGATLLRAGKAGKRNGPRNMWKGTPRARFAPYRRGAGRAEAEEATGCGKEPAGPHRVRPFAKFDGCAFHWISVVFPTRPGIGKVAEKAGPSTAETEEGMSKNGSLIAFARDLVRIPSLSGEEAGVARRTEAEMRSLDFDRVWTDEVGNVIGVMEGAQPGPTVVFDAHTDTVGVSPGVPWERDPFGGEVTKDALHGRGSADMKGALAAMVHGVGGLDRRKLKGKAVVSASVMEEVLEGVALQKVIAQTGADFVVVGEASDLQLVRGGRGRAEIHLTTTGRPSHSSAPQMGRNAVLDMMRVIGAIEDLSLDEHPQMGPAIFALTDIISEPFPGHSVIPSICRVTYDRRLLPGESAEGVLADIAQRPELEDIRLDARVGVGEYTSYTGHSFTTEKFFPAWLADDDDPFVALSAAALRTSGIDAGLNAYRFCTNAAYSAGVADIPTIGFGPATEADAHVVNEKLKLDDLIAAARGYRAIAAAALS